jgi:hypothetical protein
VRQIHLHDTFNPVEVAVAPDGTLYVAGSPSPSAATGLVEVYSASGRFLRRWG